MKKYSKILIVALIISLFFSINQLSARKNFGIGVMVGQPTGLSLKFGNFPVMGLAWNLYSGYMHIHADYWIINKTLSSPINWYLGIGGKLMLWSGSSSLDFAMRIPVGLQWFPFRNLELFGEFVPEVIFIPATGFDWDAAIGVRFYLN